MAGIHVLVRLIVSTIGALIPLLFLSGTWNSLGGYAPDLFGSQSAINSALTQFLGTQSFGSIVPLGAAGITGFVIYTFLQRALQHVEAATYSTPKMKGMNPEEILKSMQIPSMPWMGAQGAAGVPQSLPPDLTKSQFLILKTCRQGYSKPKELAKQLSTDKTEVEKEIFTLQTNGYLTKSNKLTSKAIGVLGN